MWWWTKHNQQQDWIGGKLTSQLTQRLHLAMVNSLLHPIPRRFVFEKSQDVSLIGLIQ